MNTTTSAIRWLWVAWSVLVTVTAGLVGMFGNVVLGWPQPAWLGFLIGALSIPTSALLATRHGSVRHGPAVLVATFVLAGLIGMLCGLYIGVLVVLGRRPAGDERELYALCLVAAALACALVVPVRSRLRRWANGLAQGDREPPETLLATFGGRMSRSVPMDELLLQVVEALHKTLVLSAAEVWTGEQGHLVRAASVPERGTAVVDLDPEAHHVAARARAQGNAWLELWLPELLSGREQLLIRSVPIRHQGELLGLIVLERPVDGDPFTAEEDQVLVDLARQLGLALHNVRLDSALQASVHQLEERNADLTASRARIVAVADESRRTIERDLHDGAQQRLVALAVKIGLIRSAIDSNPDAAAALDELTEDLNAAIDEMRELAHGIYPPRLRDRGLGEALRTAAARAQHVTSVDAVGVGRYSADVEAAVYFCCLEAIRNAGKYAGVGAAVTVRIDALAHELRFVVADDGCGFDLAAVSAGQGMTNMRDRVGAIGGEVTVESEPGAGTTVTGVLPARPIESASDAESRLRATQPG